jgi:hypothetical protein
MKITNRVLYAALKVTSQLILSSGGRHDVGVGGGEGEEANSM